MRCIQAKEERRTEAKQAIPTTDNQDLEFLSKLLDSDTVGETCSTAFNSAGGAAAERSSAS